MPLPHPPSPVSSDDEKNSLDHAADDFDSPAEADNQGRYSQVIEKDGARVRVEWTAEEERAVVRKADLYLLPIFAALFFFFNMDRGNIGVALSSTILKDVDLTRDQANIGTSLLWAGIVVFEIPSNIILQRVGPSWYIPLQAIVWGAVQMCNAAVTNPAGYYVARLALGLCESGFLAGALFTIHQWYRKDELAKRTVLFFVGSSFSGAFGSLIGAGCVSITGSISGWRYLFIIEGLATVIAGVIALGILPNSPRHTAGGLRGKKGWFNEHEADVFIARLQNEDRLKETVITQRIGLKDVIGTLGDWRVWPHILIAMTGLQSTLGMSTWQTVIIKSLGFSAVRANLLTMPFSIIGIFTSLALAWAVDRYQKRGLAITFAATWTLAGLIAIYCLSSDLNKRGSWSFYALLLITNIAPAWQPLNIVWISINTRTPQRRAIVLAFYMGASNAGAIYGQQVFRANDAPLYRVAWSACIGLAASWLALTVAQQVQYAWSNRRKAARWQALTEHEREAYVAAADAAGEKGATRLDFTYNL